MDSEKLLIMLFKQVHQLSSCQQATFRVLAEIAPHLSDEAVEIVRNFGRYQAEASEELLLKLEVSSPSLAALLDEDRPIPPPTPQ